MFEYELSRCVFESRCCHLNIKQSSNQLINQQIKKTLIDKISMRLLGLEFKSDNTLKSKAIKHIVKKYYLIMSKVV